MGRRPLRGLVPPYVSLCEIAPVIEPMKYVILLVLAVALFALGWAGSQFGVLPDVRSWFGSAPRAAEDSAPPTDQSARPVIALARIEPADRVVAIAAVPGERVASIAVAEGDVVEKGQPLVYLDSRPLRQFELKAIESQLKEAQARRTAEAKLADTRIIEAVVGVSRAEAQQLDLTAQRKNLDLLRANLDVAKSDQTRIEGLSKDVVSDQQRQHAGLLVRKAETEIAAAEAALKKSERLLALTQQAAEAQLSAAKAAKDQVLAAIPVDSLQQQQALAKAQLDRTVLEAPCKGTVLKVLAAAGEVVGQGPVLLMANLDRMVATAEVHETSVKWLRVGQTARLSSPAFHEPLEKNGIMGTVARIGRMIASPEMKNPNPLARADRHVVEVRIDIDTSGRAEAAALINLQVDATFLGEASHENPAGVAQSGP